MVVKKITTKAAAAKKTTEKKITAAKPAAKSTAAKTTAAKKTTTASRPSAPATEISVTGNKKIETLRKEFNKKFPYLQIRICYPAAKQDFARLGICYEVQDYHTISKVRRVEGKGEVSIAGNKKVKTIEREFEELLGLFVKVCYRETKDCSYPVSGNSEERTLSMLNSLCEKRGCIKGAWK